MTAAAACSCATRRGRSTTKRWGLHEACLRYTILSQELCKSLCLTAAAYLILLDLLVQLASGAVTFLGSWLLTLDSHPVAVPVRAVSGGEPPGPLPARPPVGGGRHEDGDQQAGRGGLPDLDLLLPPPGPEPQLLQPPGAPLICLKYERCAKICVRRRTHCGYASPSPTSRRCAAR